MTWLVVVVAIWGLCARVSYLAGKDDIMGYYPHTFTVSDRRWTVGWAVASGPIGLFCMVAIINPAYFWRWTGIRLSDGDRVLERGEPRR